MATRSVGILRNPVLKGGCQVASLTALATNKVYSNSAILFPDRAGAEIQLAFPVPLDYVSAPQFDLLLGSIGQDQTVRWELTYNVISEFQSYDPATADETLNANEGEGSNPTRLRVVNMAATAANFSAGALCLLNLERLSSAVADDSYALINLIDVVFGYSDA